MEITDYILLHTTGNLYWKDLNGNYLGCNLEFAEISGLVSPQDIVGKSDRDLFLSNLGEAGISKLTEVDQLVFRNITQISEEVGLDKSGNIAYYLTKKIPLKDSNNTIIGLVGNSLDITDRKLKEEELRKAKENAEAATKIKIEFLDNMRHNIRTPLMGISGFADIIKQEVTDPKIKEYADNLMASSHALMDLLNGILEAIKVSSGEIPLLKKKFSLYKKLQEVIALNKPTAIQKNIELQFYFDPLIPDYLIGDSTRLHRIALELVVNALNFTDKGQVLLSVSLAKGNDADAVIKMIVEDSGIGIAEERQQEIYVQFKRLTPSYEGIYKGNGLGLSIVKQFVDDLQGELYLESQLGIGSKFTVIVKFKKPLLDDSFGCETSILNTIKPLMTSQIVAKIRGSSAATHNDLCKKSRVLVVEDNDMAARIVVSMLTSMNCQAEVANKGLLAVTMAEEQSYDLIFMDIGLPDIDGYEVTKRIRLNEIHKKHVPIIALTAHVDDENKRQCISIGMNAVLTKPLLRETTENILNAFIAYRNMKSTVEVLPTSIEGFEITGEVLNFDYVKTQCGDEAIAIEIISSLVNSFPEVLIKIQQLHKEQQWDLIQGEARKLRDGASYCGTKRLEEACAYLEQGIKLEKIDLYENLYQQTMHEIAQAQQAIESVCGSVANNSSISKIT